MLKKKMFSCHKIIIDLQLNNTLLIVLSLLNRFSEKKWTSIVCGGGGGGVHASHPPPYGPVNEFTLLLSKQVSRKKKTCNNIKYFPYLELATTVAS